MRRLVTAIDIPVNQLLLAIGIALLLQPVGSSAAAGNSLNGLLPPGVHLGMTDRELQNVRTGAFSPKLARETENVGDFKLVEHATDSGNRVAIWYHFEESALRGILTTKTYTAAGAGGLVKVLDADVAAGNLSRVGVQKILRTNGIKAFELTATHLKGAEDGVEAYVVISNQELTFVVFDPKHLSAGNFFLDTTQRDRVNANGVRIKQKLSEQGQELSAAQQAEIVDIPLLAHSPQPIQFSQTASAAVYQRSIFWSVSAVVVILVAVLFLLWHRGTGKRGQL